MKTQKGITLIALIITIIVMLILVGVSVSIALNTGLFETAQGVAENTQLAANEEKSLAEGIITIRNSTTGNLEQVDIDSFFRQEEQGEKLLDIGAPIGTQVNYSAGGVIDWRIYKKNEAAGTVTLLGKVSINGANITTEEELNSYIGTQYIDPNYEDKIKNVSVITASDIFDTEWIKANPWQVRNQTTQEVNFISLFGLENNIYWDQVIWYSGGYIYSDCVNVNGETLSWEDAHNAENFLVLVRGFP